MFLMPMVEYCGLIVVLGYLFLRETCRQFVQWRESGFELPQVSVNLSVKQLERPEFIDVLEQILDETGMDPTCLKFELTESVVMAVGDSFTLLERLRELGISLALDDFGTGYSSLTYFRRLPAQTLKIDQSFIRDLLVDPEDLAIAQGIIGLAQAFQRTVIAEGVETAEHGSRLLKMGCHLAQGYGIARPMPASELPGWIENYTAPSVWTQTRT